MKRTIRFAAMAAAALVTAAVTTASAGAADPSEDFDARHPVSGAVKLAKSAATVPVGPTALSIKYRGVAGNDNAFDFDASLPLPSKTIVFKAFGYLPVRAKVSFKQVGYFSGRALNDSVDGDANVDGSVSYSVTLSDVIIGYTKADVGNTCRLKSAIVAEVASDDGFDLYNGGTLRSTFDVGPVTGCRTSTDLLNLILPGGGNTLTANVGPAE